MSIGDILLTALTSSALTVGLIALIWSALKATVTRTISHQFDLALEEAKSALKRDEERFRNALAAEGQRLGTMQQQLLRATAARNEVLDRRRIEAAEALWASVVEMSPLQLASNAAQVIKMLEAREVAATQTPDGLRMRNAAKMIAESFGFSLDKFKPETKPDKHRLFVSPIVWALFSTYRSLVFEPVMRLKLMEVGAAPKIMKDGKELLAAVRAALPYMGSFIDEYGYSSLAFLTDTLREDLYKAIVASLDQPETDQKSLDRATEIMKLVDRASSAASQPEPVARAQP